MKVGTAQLKRGAVTTKKLHSAAVTPAKLDRGAVTTEKLSPSAGGVALAGVHAAGETVEAWFNRLGGQPSVDRTSEGVYTVQLPGFDNVRIDSAIQSATIEDASGGEISVRPFTPSASPAIPIIRTFDSAGNPADRTFYYTVFQGANAG